jgi:phosphatidylserine/phosphatidylglycerophosphate/cardiolipin synthase-like enzyme
MHHKLGLFDYGSTHKSVFVTSWNFTGGASTYQWNIAIEIRNAALYAACEREADELVAGRFHDHASKSHAHDGSRFTLNGSWGPNVARFSPCPEGFVGGDNTLTEIVGLIREAESEICFALNKLTVKPIAEALAAAVDRGVSVRGVLPRSETGRGGDSAGIYRLLSRSATYRKADRVRLLRAYSKGDRSALDNGQHDLVHTKYMVLDPRGRRPVVIHGSANWTYSGLMDTDANDETVLILRHGGIAKAFSDHFKLLAAE